MKVSSFTSIDNNLFVMAEPQMNAHTKKIAVICAIVVLVLGCFVAIILHYKNRPTAISTLPHKPQLQELVPPKEVEQVIPIIKTPQTKVLTPPTQEPLPLSKITAVNIESVQQQYEKELNSITAAVEAINNKPESASIQDFFELQMRMTQLSQTSEIRINLTSL